MKVLLALHGYPPELVGGTESAVRELAHGLVAAGHEVVVVAGTLRHEQGFRRSLEFDEVGAGRPAIRVHKIHRADLYFDHWQKSASARASLAFRDILREEKPDVVHVHHWIRLSRDLVHRSALEGVPAVVTLHDLWTTCLVTFRVRPESGEFCTVKLAPAPCIKCAAQVPPRTPWSSFESQGIALLERSADLARELELARAVVTPTRAHGEAVTRYLGLAAERLKLAVVPNGRALALRRRSPLALAPADKLVLGMWGHLYRLKGADRVLRAVRSLREPRRVELHIAGGEPDAVFAGELRELAQGLDVRFHGPYDAGALDAHPVSAVHAFVSGTLAHESFGLVLDEAVALGLPLVLPQSGAYAERLAEEQGALFYAQGDERDLARVLQRLLDEPGLLARLRTSLPEPQHFTPSGAAQVAALVALYADARRAGAPDARVVSERERIWQAGEDAWARALQQCSGKELGFE
ncbi:MAG: glycosyltransferase [Planctomycetes bacterium]|nr:glycosyltransferase [Planctomycetota bacterium]